MKIPEILFGPASKVHSKVKKEMESAKDRMTWDGFASSRMIETETFGSDMESARVLFGIEKTTKKQEHFRMYAPLYTFKFSWGTYRIYDEYNMLFDVLVNTQWGLLVLLSPIFSIPTKEQDEKRVTLFFERLYHEWDAIVSQPNLFLVGPENKSKGDFFWNFADSQLLTAMSGAGFPLDELGKQRIEAIQPALTKNWIKKHILN